MATRVTLRHRSDHTTLLAHERAGRRTLHDSSPNRARSVDALVVPASRGTSELTAVAELAARGGWPLVLACSKKVTASAAVEVLGEVRLAGGIVALDCAAALPGEECLGYLSTT